MVLLSVALAAGSMPAIGATGGIGAIFGGMLAEGAAKAGRSAPAGQDFEAALVRASNTVNKSLPVVVDKSTRLDNVTAGPGRRFTYNYTLVNTAARDFDRDYFLREMSRSLRKGVCTNDDMQIFLRNGVVIAYAYRLHDGQSVGRVEISPTHCGI